MSRCILFVRTSLLFVLAVLTAAAACTAPVIGDVVLTPVNVTAGLPVRLGAVVTPGGAPIAAVTADVSLLDPAQTAPIPLPYDADTGRYEATVIPTVSGQRSVTVTATDTAGGNDSRVFQLNVLPGDPPIVLLQYELQPATARPGQTVTASLAAVSSVGGTLSGTLDLSPINLSAATPLVGSGSSLSATFTVPQGIPSGPKSIAAMISDGRGNTVRPVRTLTVSAGPVVQTVTASPSFVDPGGALTLCATVEPGPAAISSVTADLSPIGLSTVVTLTHTGGNTWCATVTVPVSAPTGVRTFTVTATDAAGQNGTGSVTVRVEPRDPPEILSLAFSPPDIHPMGVTDLLLQVEVGNCAITSVTADLSPIGGESGVPLTSDNGTAYVRYVGTGNLAPGRYPVTVTVRDECGNVFKPVAILNVTLAPLINSVSIYPSPAAAGDTVNIVASVRDGWGSGIRSVTADLSALGLPPLPLAWSSNGYTAAFVVPGKVFGPTYTIPITAVDSEGRFTTKTGTLSILTGQPPSIQLSVGFEPDAVHAGESAMLQAVINGDDYILVQSLWADLSPLGLSSSAPLERVGIRGFRKVVDIPAGTAPGTHRIAVADVPEPKDNGYMASGVATLTVLPPRARGDVNGDLAINLADAVAALRLAGGLSAAAPLSVTAGDVAGAGLDGHTPDNRLTLADAIALARMLEP